MARSKSKNRLSQKADAKSNKGQELPKKGSNDSLEFIHQHGQSQLVQVEGTRCSTSNDGCCIETGTKCDAGVGLLEKDSNQAPTSAATFSPAAVSVETEAKLGPSVDYELLVKQQEMEAALEQVDLWLSESSSEHENPECLATCLPLETRCELTEELNLVLPDYRLESQQAAKACGVQESQPELCRSNQLIAVESQEQPESPVLHSADVKTGLDVDSVCQRLEATASAIEVRLEQLWNGFESNLNSRLSQMLQVLDRLPQQAFEMHVDSKTNTRESSSHSKSIAPAEASWETRKRQMLSEFGMTVDEIENLAPGQGNANSLNEKSKMATNVESVALEALHSSLETLDKIDSGIRSEEIDRLKEQLTAQLREAEVELSINRAKLCKEWATLEQRATELGQRESALKSKYNDAESTTKHGLLDRITRHLSRRS